MRWNYTPASLQVDANGLVQQAGSKRFNKTSRASELSTTESEASWEGNSRSSQTSMLRQTRHSTVKDGETLRLKQPALTKWWALKCLCWARHLRLPSPTCRPAQPTVCEGKSETGNDKGSLKLWMEIMNAGMVSFAFFSMAWVMQWQSPNLASAPLQKQAEQLDALLLSIALPWGRQPRLKTKVVPSKVKGKDWKLRQYSSMDKSWAQGHWTSRS